MRLTLTGRGCQSVSCCAPTSPRTTKWGGSTISGKELLEIEVAGYLATGPLRYLMARFTSPQNVLDRVANTGIHASMGKHRPGDPGYLLVGQRRDTELRPLGLAVTGLLRHWQSHPSERVRQVNVPTGVRDPYREVTDQRPERAEIEFAVATRRPTPR